MHTVRFRDSVKVRVTKRGLVKVRVRKRSTVKVSSSITLAK